MTTVYGQYADAGWTPAKPDGWWNHAICRDEDPHTFEPLPGDVLGNMAALKICATCPLWVKDACLKEALDTGDTTTIRGGTTPDDRKELLRKKALAGLAEGRRNFAAANAARLAHRKVCDKDHPQTDENTFINGDGYVCCKPCRAENQREYRQRRNARDAEARELVQAGAR